MFDRQSASLLQDAPEIPGIVPENLPSLLTEIYTELVTNRLTSNNGTLNTDSVNRLMEIANSYEIITSLFEGNDRSRSAAAFVAGSAYQILSKSITVGEEEAVPALSRDHIDGKIAASLLFLIAEQYPDAREAISHLNISKESTPLLLQLLTESLVDLVMENHLSIQERGIRRQQLELLTHYDTQTRAMLHLYEMILQGIEFITAEVLETRPIGTIATKDFSAVNLFTLVIELSTRQFTNVPFTGGFLSTYPGPAHLASLLLKTTRSLQDASIMLIPTPDLVDEIIWKDWLKFRAQSKPILWPNHRDTIAKGFHKPGNSAVMVLPTGAGKTTLSEFKIAAMLASGKKVIFLAPTNALVEQLKNDLSQALPEEIFGNQKSFENELFTTVDDTLSSLEIMTPEKCLAILNFNPNSFEDLGLVVFDECHSLAADSGSLRRSIDGMLVILNLQHVVPSIDFLFLSAMLQNGDEFAKWIESLTLKTCLAIDLVWKPSRQARGIIIYPEDELTIAKQAATIIQKKEDQNAGKLSVNVRSAPNSFVKATPHALFGLINNWHPEKPEDIRIRKLSNTKYQLAAKFDNYRKINITSNGNDVARNLAISCALAGMKVIVFTNNANWTYSSAKKIGPQIPGDISYTDHEKQLWKAIETEFGSSECSMLYQMKHSVPHNANLIKFERQLAESLYKRPNGAEVIFATTTLSQGMNLPAQVAILSADERASLGSEFVTQEPLKAHELLNAAGRAGRAGRAGYLANGMVILVPRMVLTFNGEQPELYAKDVLRSIIPENEHCVKMIDPLQNILDLIQENQSPQAEVEYLFYRLAEEKVNDTFSRSFAAYIATKNGKIESFNRQVERFKTEITKQQNTAKLPEWLSLIAIQSGISPTILLSLYTAIKNQFTGLPISIEGWVSWLITWFNQNVDAGRYCFGNDLQSLKSITGFKTIDSNNYDAALNTLSTGLITWIKGMPIINIEQNMSGKIIGNSPVCSRAREIITNIASRDLSFFSTFLVQITKKVAEELDLIVKYPATLECLPVAISKGFDQPAKLAYFQQANDRYLSRVEAHQRFNVQFSSLQFNERDDYKAVAEVMRMF